MCGLVEIKLVEHLYEIINQRERSQTNANCIAWLDAVHTLRIGQHIEHTKKFVKTVAQHLDFCEHDEVSHLKY